MALLVADRASFASGKVLQVTSGRHGEVGEGPVPEAGMTAGPDCDPLALFGSAAHFSR
jgi:hypothetical protein